ncbi:hypothetical protein FACS189499_04680 [Clostridia bacterium]|nr:hypothetical protein FACS189499_04680 [Clostridia bacterium]
MTKYEGVIISGILFSSMLVFILSFEMITTTELSDLAHIILLVINFIFVLIDAFAMHFVFAQSKVNMIKYENEQFKKMELLKVNYVDNLKANYDEIHRLKHDMKNVINGVMSLIYENKSELAAQKLNEFRTDIEKCEVYVNTDNVFVNTVLNLKISDAKEQNIKVVYKIAEDLSKYNDLDLCYILGNLLDNAIEACKKCSEPFIDISIEYINSRLNITIKNSVNTSEPITFKTSKADKTNHGIGLKSVKMTVDKYEGELDYYSKGNTVVVFVLL